MTVLFFLAETIAVTLTVTGGWHSFKRAAIQINGDKYLIYLMQARRESSPSS